MTDTKGGSTGFLLATKLVNKCGLFPAMILRYTVQDNILQGDSFVAIAKQVWRCNFVLQRQEYNGSHPEILAMAIAVRNFNDGNSKLSTHTQKKDGNSKLVCSLFSVLLPRTHMIELFAEKHELSQ